MPFLKPEEKGIPGKNLIYFGVGLVIFGLILTNIVLNLVWQRPFINNLRERLLNYEMAEGKRAAGTIEKFIQKEMGDIEDLSGDISQAGTGSKGSEFFINRFLNENSAVKELSIIKLDGEELARYSKKEFFAKRDVRDFSSLEEFEVAKEGRNYMGEVNFTEYAEPYVIIAVPLRKLEIEKPQGVLRAVFHLGQAWAEVLEMKIGETGRISIVDNKGMLIADPNPSRVLKKTNLLSLPPTKPILSGEIFKGEEYLNEKEIKVLGLGIPLKNLGWGVIVEEDVSEFLAPVKEITKLAIIFFSSGAIIAGILIWLLIILKRTDKSLVERYLALEKSQTEIEEAKQLLEIKVKARTKELQELAAGLEEKVKERTEELQEKVNEMGRFQKLTVGREIKMVELKKEIERLKEEIKKPKRVREKGRKPQ